MSIYFILSAVIAYLIYRDAKNKWGYSQNTAMLWALGTLALPYVVGVAYILLGRKPRWKIPQEAKPSDAVTYEGGEDAVDISEKIPCPMCGSRVPSSFGQCPKCGYTLHFCCTHCGSTLERGAKYCPECGTKAPDK
jgi:hypothetical protein